MGIPERKEREKENRRNEILEAAQRLFFEKGLQSSTMDEIAEAAELSKGTLYLYYGSKEDIYLAVMIRGFEVLHEMVERVLREEKPVVVLLRRLGEVYLEFFNQHRNYFRMFTFYQHTHFHKQVSPEMLQCCTDQNQKTWTLVNDLIRRGIAEGMLDPELNPAEITIVLWSSGTALLARLDNQMEYWKSFGMDLERLFQLSNALIVEAIMTPRAREQYPDLFSPNTST